MQSSIRIVSVLMGILLLLSLVTACQNGTGEEPSDTTTIKLEDTSGIETTTENDQTTTPAPNPEDEQPEPTVISIFTAEQLLLVANMMNEDETGEATKGVIYRLAADIDLNEGWSASVEATDGKVTSIPSAPATVWPGIRKFCGTLDGNGKKISGLYLSETPENNGVVGFIRELSGGTVKNLTIENSFFGVTVEETVEKVSIGGLVGTIGEASVLENVSVGINILVRGADTITALGIVGSYAADTLTETETQFTGSIYHEDLPSKYKSVTEFSETDPEGTVYGISTAEELLAFAEKVGGSTQKGKGFVFKLTGDIDLNPGWTAAPVIDAATKNVTFPTAATQEWNCFNFAGTFDGQGHSISGLYKDREFGEWGDQGLFFKHLLDNAVVQNLVLKNGIYFGHQPNNQTSNRIIGGLASYVNGNNVTIENVYLDIHVWDSGYSSVKLGGVVGRINNEKTGLTIRNVVFAGTIGSVPTKEATTFPSTSTGAQAGQLIGDANGRPSTCANTVLCGSIFTASGTWDSIAKNNGSGSKVQTNIVIGKFESVENAQSAGKITGYNAETIDMTYNAEAGTIVPTPVAGFLTAVE